MHTMSKISISRVTFKQHYILSSSSSRVYYCFTLISF
nr:MAG TPA: hypothetical protein [Bacteriophage sp.]